MKRSVVLIISGVFLLLTACDSAANKNHAQSTTPGITRIVDYSNGVYYFDYTKASFANALSGFIKEHPELELSALTGDGTCGYGADAGYFAVFKQKK